MTELRYGRLTVLHFNGRSKGGIMRVLCKCDCGEEEEVLLTLLDYNIATECRECKSKRENGLLGPVK